MTDDKKAQLQRLFDRAMEAGPTHAALDRLIYCHLLDRITSGNLEVALEEFAAPSTAEAALRELESLTDNEREELAQAVIPMWNAALSQAVIHMWSGCRRLGYDPEGLGGDHLAILGALFLGELADAVHSTDEPGS